MSSACRARTERGRRRWRRAVLLLAVVGALGLGGCVAVLDKNAPPRTARPGAAKGAPTAPAPAAPAPATTAAAPAPAPFAAAPAAPARSVLEAPSADASPRTLSELVAESDLVGRALVTGIDEGRHRGAGAPTRVAATLVESVKGPSVEAVVFEQAESEVSGFVVGDEVMLFVRDAANPRPAAPDAVPAVPPPPPAPPRWVALQRTIDTPILGPASRAAWVDASRRYVAAGAFTTYGDQITAFRSLTVDLLNSGQSALIHSAIGDLARAPAVPLLTRLEVPKVQHLLDDPQVGIENRIGLLTELERRQLVFGPSRWVRWLRTTPPPELLLVIQAAGTRRSDGITRELVVLLGRRDPAVIVAAADALAVPGNHAAVAALGAALGDPEPAVRRAVLASLERIQTEGARRMLELAAAYHPDPTVRQEAGLGAVILARRHGTTLAPPPDTLAPRGSGSGLPGARATTPATADAPAAQAPPPGASGT